jgi:hypothetical protein
MSSVKSAISKPAWGNVKSSINGAGDAPPQLTKPSTGGPIGDLTSLLDLDLANAEIKPTLRDGPSDKFLEFAYKGSRLNIKLGDLPDFRRAPFAAAAPKNAPDPRPGKSDFSFVVNLTPEEYDTYKKFETDIIAKLAPRATELMAHTFKKPAPGKPPKTMSVAEFEEAWNSPLKAADPDKGYPATMRISVPTVAMTADGKARTLPKIYTCKLKGPNAWSQPKEGTVGDLKAKAAVCPIVSLFRGIYFGQVGAGMKFVLSTCYVFTNLSGSKNPTFDTSHMNIVPDSEDEENEVSKPSKTELALAPGDDDALAGYNDGTM